jgi:hypothetical protein
MTEYRTINDGYWDFLQYKVIKKNFWGKEKETWEYVLDARFDNIDNIQNYFDFDRLVCSLNHNLKSWVNTYPDISMWISKREQLIEEHRAKRNAFDKEKESKRGKINYL